MADSQQPNQRASMSSPSFAFQSQLSQESQSSQGLPNSLDRLPSSLDTLVMSSDDEVFKPVTSSGMLAKVSLSSLASPITQMPPARVRASLSASLASKVPLGQSELAHGYESEAQSSTDQNSNSSNNNSNSHLPSTTTTGAYVTRISTATGSEYVARSGLSTHAVRDKASPPATHGLEWFGELQSGAAAKLWSRRASAPGFGNRSEGLAPSRSPLTTRQFDAPRGSAPRFAPLVEADERSYAGPCPAGEQFLNTLLAQQKQQSARRASAPAFVDTEQIAALDVSSWRVSSQSPALPAWPTALPLNLPAASTKDDAAFVESEV